MGNLQQRRRQDAFRGNSFAKSVVHFLGVDDICHDHGVNLRKIREPVDHRQTRKTLRRVSFFRCVDDSDDFDAGPFSLAERGDFGEISAARKCNPCPAVLIADVEEFGALFTR